MTARAMTDLTDKCAGPRAGAGRVGRRGWAMPGARHASPRGSPTPPRVSLALIETIADRAAAATRGAAPGTGDAEGPPVRAGMQAQVELHTGEKTVLGYLTRPPNKAGEALREP